MSVLSSTDAGRFSSVQEREVLLRAINDPMLDEVDTGLMVLQIHVRIPLLASRAYTRIRTVTPQRVTANYYHKAKLLLRFQKSAISPTKWTPGQ